MADASFSTKARITDCPPWRCKVCLFATCGVNEIEDGPLHTSDVVLMPGSTVPMKLTRPEEISLLHTALHQGQHLRRLIVLVCQQQHRRPSKFGRGQLLEDSVACTAEIRQLKREEDGSIYVVAKGRQRVLRLKMNGDTQATKKWDAAAEGHRMHVRVLPEGNVSRLPAPIALGAAHWQPWAARGFDPTWLAERATQLCGAVLPAAAGFRGGPLELSYWLAGNLPLGIDKRCGGCDLSASSRLPPLLSLSAACDVLCEQAKRALPLDPPSPKDRAAAVQQQRRAAEARGRPAAGG